MNNIYQKFKEVSFLIAGALVGIIFIPYENKISLFLPLIVGCIIFLILFGIGLFEWIFFVWIFLKRAANKEKQKICIFAPYEIDSDTSSYVSISLRQLSEKLKANKINFSINKSESSFLKYPVVINPYGGSYPEKDVSTFRSLTHIFSYVCNGGIYVNIADIPFYYAFDQSLRRRIDTTPLAGDFSQLRSFLQTILTKKLHCFVFGLKDGDDFNNGITRVISLSNNSKNFFNKKISINGEDCSPVLAIPYGKGYFIFSTIQIKKENINQFIDLIKKVLKLY